MFQTVFSLAGGHGENNKAESRSSFKARHRMPGGAGDAYVVLLLSKRGAMEIKWNT